MNKLNNKIPFLGLYLFAFIVGLILLLLKFIMPDIMYHDIWAIFAFFFFLTLASLYVIQRLAAKKPKNFLTIYFSVMVIRLFISIIFAAIFILLDRDNVFIFAINFMALYLSFLGFEIYGIITNLRTHFKKRTRDE